MPTSFACGPPHERAGVSALAGRPAAPALRGGIAPPSDAGFTLVELAVVMLVAGLLLGSVLGPLGLRWEAEQRRRTGAALALALEALYGHAQATGRLPCPDCLSAEACPGLPAAARGDGLEDLRDEVCATLAGAQAWGALPGTTLGITARDARGHRLGYAVTGVFADHAPAQECAGLPAPGVSFGLCTQGTLAVWDGGGAAARPLGDALPAVVVAHGGNAVFAADGRLVPSAPDTAEADNADGDARFRQEPYGTAGFDDQLAWVAWPVLMHRMVSAGQLP